MGVGARVAFGALGRELFGIVKNAATCASVDSGYLVLFLPPFIIARGSSRAQCGLPRPTAARAATGRCSSRSRRTRVAPRPRRIFAAAQEETPVAGARPALRRRGRPRARAPLPLHLAADGAVRLHLHPPARPVSAPTTWTRRSLSYPKQMLSPFLTGRSRNHVVFEMNFPVWLKFMLTAIKVAQRCRMWLAVFCRRTASTQCARARASGGPGAVRAIVCVT